MICPTCTNILKSQTETASGLCNGCMSATKGYAKACPGCGCPLVARIEGLFGDWEWTLSVPHPELEGAYQPRGEVHYCPESGCDLEAEFHLARKEAKRERAK